MRISGAFLISLLMSGVALAADITADFPPQAPDQAGVAAGIPPVAYIRIPTSTANTMDVIRAFMKRLENVSILATKSMTKTNI